MPTFQITFDEPEVRPAGAEGLAWPIQVGVPFAEGAHSPGDPLYLADLLGDTYEGEITDTLNWPGSSESVRWSLVETQVTLPESGSEIEALVVQDSAPGSSSSSDTPDDSSSSETPEVVRRIHLESSDPAPVTVGDQVLYRVVITADESENMPVEVFKHELTLTGLSGEQFERFVSVCHPWDLADFPVNTPNAGQWPPYYRKDTIDVYLPGPLSAQEFIEEVHAEVSQLVTHLNDLDNMDLLEETEIEGSS